MSILACNGRWRAKKCFDCSKNLMCSQNFPLFTRLSCVNRFLRVQKFECIFRTFKIVYVRTFVRSKDFKRTSCLQKCVCSSFRAFTRHWFVQINFMSSMRSEISKPKFLCLQVSSFFRSPDLTALKKIRSSCTRLSWAQKVSFFPRASKNDYVHNFGRSPEVREFSIRTWVQQKP